MAVTAVDARRDDRSTDVDHATALLRRAVADCGYTLDALETAMGKGRAYIHRVLQGEDRVTLDFITLLPDDVEARFEQLRAEQFGLIVAAPARDAEDAARQLLSGASYLLGNRRGVA